MALVAVDAVVDVTRNTVMFRIRLRSRMAIRALEYREIVRVGVASGTNAVGVAVIDWEPRVVESRVRPTRRVVARRARGRESRSRVIRVRRPRVVGFVARVAIGRRARENAADMA